MNTDALEGAIGLLVLWVIWTVLFHGYFTDRLRQHLFGIRDELFDYAASGAIDFRHPAYGLLRGMMNAQIRFAHRIKPLNIIAIATASSPGREAVGADGLDSPRDAWLDFTNSLENHEVRDELLRFETRVKNLAIEHLLISSLPLLVLLCAALALHILRRLMKRGFRYCKTLWIDLRTPDLVTLGLVFSTVVHVSPSMIDKGVQVMISDGFLDAALQQQS